MAQSCEGTAAGTRGWSLAGSTWHGVEEGHLFGDRSWPMAFPLVLAAGMDGLRDRREKEPVYLLASG